MNRTVKAESRSSASPPLRALLLALGRDVRELRDLVQRSLSRGPRDHADARLLFALAAVFQGRAFVSRDVFRAGATAPGLAAALVDADIQGGNTKELGRRLATLVGGVPIAGTTLESRRDRHRKVTVWRICGVSEGDIRAPVGS